MSENRPSIRPGEVHQVIGADKEPLPAWTAPGGFIGNSCLRLAEHDGPVFAEPTHGNKVKFFTTGREYFSTVAAAIENAKESVFIAGWQVNHDVILTGKKRLIDCLDKAIEGSASVYVMPWLSPKAGVDTNDFETMLAVFLLNAGRPGVPRAFCMPAVQQSDMGKLGIFFAHHQKLVVIDNKEAYVGGIDLAYGRRDDASFALEADADGRQGREMYNPCIPPLQQLWSDQQAAYLTQGELLSACLVSRLASVASLASRTSSGARDLLTPDFFREWWDSSDFFKDFTEWYRQSAANRLAGEAQGSAMDAAADGAIWAHEKLPPALRKSIEAMREQGTAHVSNLAGAMLAWLNGGSLQDLPPEIRDTASALGCAITMRVCTFLAQHCTEQPRYAPLFKAKRTMLPRDGKILDAKRQPRMPWQDIQARVEGPAVYDLSMNFVRRWNSIQATLANEAKFLETYGGSHSQEYRTLLQTLGLDGASLKKMPIPTWLYPKRSAAAAGGQASVQVLRSAPAALLKAEKAAMPDHVPYGTDVPQDNCLKAMIQAINGAQRFIYIEGQFFQSDHGGFSEFDPSTPSGPLASLTKIYGLPGYARFNGPLNLEFALRSSNPVAHIRWSGIPRIQSDPDYPAFMEGLKRQLANNASVEISRRQGPVQAHLGNKICQALGERIEWAIGDGLPFHVYLVLPVHPEGTLDTLNIMSQVHYTMQSLIFGQHSLVNRVRRALYRRKLIKEKGMAPGAAAEEANKLSVDDLNKIVGNESWKEYLTLLNLRNWFKLKSGKVVTEQIYVHSKLLIADDRVAILGSANINDRSLLGGRDSELAIVVHDKASAKKMLDGEHEEDVSVAVQELRSDLWKKHFGLTSGLRPAKSLAALIDRPADPATWRAIQKVAKRNADAYDAVFPFIPRNVSPVQPRPPGKTEDPAASLWPTWYYNDYVNHFEEKDSRHAGGQLKQPMPFEADFWKPEITFQEPEGVQGFIVTLPIAWTHRENNDSGLNLRILAHFDMGPLPGTTQMAAANSAQVKESV